MRENKRIKLKYVATSFSSAQKQSDVFESGKYEVYGASGLVGYLDTYGCDTPYIGIVKDGAGVGRTNIYKSHTNLLGTMAYIIPRDPDSTNLHFLQYAIAALDLGNTAGDKATIPHIYFSVYGNQYILDVPIAVQNLIADNLDDKCTQVNALVANVQAQIEKLKAYKQSLITEVVSKGLDPTVPMKDSGVEWIGSIPIGWKLIPFRHVLKERQEKNSPIKSEERLSLSIDLGVTLYAEKTTNLDRFKDDFEQYKLAYEGDLVMNSMNMIVGATGVSDYFGCVSPVYYTFYDELEDHVTAKYCEYIFKSKTMLRVLYSLGKVIYAIVRGDDRVNTCRLKVSKEDLKSIISPVPPVEEQREIVNYLKKKCAAIDELITKKEQYLSEIENYKKSLIYEYVTGKKEV